MSDFLRHINKPKPPEPWYIKTVSYIAAAIIFILGGFIILDETNNTVAAGMILEG